MTRVDVLDHGYIELVEHWGSDERIIEAARMSTGKGFLGWGPCCVVCNTEKRYCLCHDGPSADSKAGDEKLLRYLWENKHATPFEMAGATFEVKAPIMVLREWMRHRTQGFNEMSGRYVALPDENYIPSVERLLLSSKTNKQAGTVAGAAELDAAGAERFRAYLVDHYKWTEVGYQTALLAGVPKELARVHLPVARYSRMRATANLRNWLAFLTLRADSHAMWEIQQYAFVAEKLLASEFPRTLQIARGFTIGGQGVGGKPLQ